jgi:hypothetical protein
VTTARDLVADLDAEQRAVGLAEADEVFAAHDAQPQPSTPVPDRHDDRWALAGSELRHLRVAEDRGHRRGHVVRGECAG